MTTIGVFRREGAGFAGRLQTLSLDTSLRLTPNDKRSDKAPDYLVLVGDQACGAAWKAVDEGSGALLNLKLDDPCWPGPVNARLMAGEGELFPLVWIRRSD